jgi:aerobic-type carbon monoxide dehydrogenase small subunit (CoxS/CutS family)
MHGLAVTTVEGIGSIKKGLHPVQVIDMGINMKH